VSLTYIIRHGSYYRVCKPDWVDCGDTSYSRRFGGRWTPPGEFGALYLCASIEVAAAVARAQHMGRAIPLFSLRPSRRPQLQRFSVAGETFVDLVTEQGVAAAGFPPDYPYAVTPEQCWSVAREAYAHHDNGIACRSAAECGPRTWLGEELAKFDSSRRPRRVGERLPFSKWYPDVIADFR
jgi:RES domain-containing protein